MEAQEPEPCDLVVRIVQEPGSGDKVLHVCSLEKSQAPVLAVRHLANRKLDLDEIAVVGGSHEDRLIREAGRRFHGLRGSDLRWLWLPKTRSRQRKSFGLGPAARSTAKSVWSPGWFGRMTFAASRIG